MGLQSFAIHFAIVLVKLSEADFVNGLRTFSVVWRKPLAEPDGPANACLALTWYLKLEQLRWNWNSLLQILQITLYLLTVPSSFFLYLNPSIGPLCSPCSISPLAPNHFPDLNNLSHCACVKCVKKIDVINNKQRINVVNALFLTALIKI